jgi:uncharacterized membrane protein
MAVDSVDRSFASILGDVADHVQRIVRAEFRLARLEVREELRRLERASVLLAVGLVAATLAIALILLAAVYALSTVMAPSAAALLVGVVVAAVSIACVLAGWKRLYGISLPRTTTTIQKTSATIQENLQWTKTRAR